MRFCLAVCLVWLCAVPCQAELFTLREHVRQIDSGDVALGVDSSSFVGRVAGSRYTLVAPTLGASFRVGEVVFEGALPFAYLNQRADEAGRLNNVALGNPFLGLAYLPDCSCGLSRLSLGWAPDLATDGSFLDRTALTLARHAQGNWDAYLWTPDLMPLVAGASTLMPLGRLRLVWDGDVVVGLPGQGRDRELGFQSAGDAGLGLGSRLVFGGRLQAAYYPTFAGDHFQATVSAYLRLRLGQQTFGLRYLVNLDGPAGFSFRDDRVWGLGVSLATAL